jgi:hypothetical protein
VQELASFRHRGAVYIPEGAYGDCLLPGQPRALTNEHIIKGDRLIANQSAWQGGGVRAHGTVEGADKASGMGLIDEIGAPLSMAL